MMPLGSLRRAHIRAVCELEYVRIRMPWITERKHLSWRGGERHKVKGGPTEPPSQEFGIRVTGQPGSDVSLFNQAAAQITQYDPGDARRVTARGTLHP